MIVLIPSPWASSPAQAPSMMVFIKISGIDAEDMPKGFEGQRADKSDEDEGMEDEGQDENRHR